jgi:hypothetical protein
LTSYQVDKRLVLSVFGFFFAINLITSGGHLDWSDGVLTFLVVESMAVKNSAQLHPDLPSISLLYGDSEARELKSDVAHYTHRSLLLAAIAIPFYYVANILSISPVFLVAFLVNSLIIALTSLTVFCFSLEIYSSRKIAFALSLVFTGCSFILPYNTSLFPQPLQALCIVSAAYFLYKSRDKNCPFIAPNSTNEGSAGSISNACNKRGIYFASLGGLFLGLSVFAHPTSIIVIPGFIAFNIFSSLIYRKKRKIAVFLISLAVILVALALSNYIRFGTFTEFGYYQYASWSWSKLGWIGLIGLWISPGAGLIVFFPAVVLLPLALKYMYSDNRQLFFLILYILFANWIYFGTLSYMDPISWSGGLAWGPRYLVPVLPFITLALGTLMTRLRNNKQKQYLLRVSIVISIFLIGFIINLLGTMVWIYYFHLYSWEEQQIWRFGGDRIWDQETWNPYYSPIVLDIKILAEGYISNIQLQQFNGTGWQFVTYGLFPCSYDLYIFCKLGVIPVIMLMAVLVTLSIFIVGRKEAHKPIRLISESMSHLKYRKRN